MDVAKLPIIGKTTKTLETYEIEYGFAVFVIGVLVLIFGLNAVHISQSRVITFVVVLAPLWLPYIAFHVFFEKWMEMVGKKYALKVGRTTLEIILPPEVRKSPEAMEFILNQIYNPASPDNLMQTYLDGKRPLAYSLELVSRGGDVHFYMNVPRQNVQAISDNFYAQYPGVEVRQVPVDYTAEIQLDKRPPTFMSFHIGKKKEAIFPIKTYLDFGMDKLPKEEEKVDPMTPMLEVLAGIQPQQQIWIQFLCKAHRDKNFKHGQLHSKPTWEADIKKKIDEIMQRDAKKTGAMDFMAFPRLTIGEQDQIKRMERNGSKYAYDFACRFVYLSQKEGDFGGGIIGRVLRTFAQTEERGGNGLGVKWRTDLNYKVYSDPFGKRLNSWKRQELKEYKLRTLYQKQHSGIWSVASTEEIATLFHLPGTVAFTPTLNRVTSTRGEAPANLPIRTSNPD